MKWAASLESKLLKFTEEEKNLKSNIRIKKLSSQLEIKKALDLDDITRKAYNFFSFLPELVLVAAHRISIFFAAYKRLVVAHGIHFSTRDQTRAPCIRSTES